MLQTVTCYYLALPFEDTAVWSGRDVWSGRGRSVSCLAFLKLFCTCLTLVINTGSKEEARVEATAEVCRNIGSPGHQQGYRQSRISAGISAVTDSGDANITGATYGHVQEQEQAELGCALLMEHRNFCWILSSGVIDCGIFIVYKRVVFFFFPLVWTYYCYSQWLEGVKLNQWMIEMEILQNNGFLQS